MRAAQYNRRVTFYRPTATGQNASGEDTSLDLEIGTAWCRITSMQGRELEAARQTWAEARFKIELPHPLTDFSLQRKDYLKLGTRQLDILDVEDPDQSRRGIVMLAKEYTD